MTRWQRRMATWRWVPRAATALVMLGSLSGSACQAEPSVPPVGDPEAAAAAPAAMEAEGSPEAAAAAAAVEPPAAGEPASVKAAPEPGETANGVPDAVAKALAALERDADGLAVLPEDDNGNLLLPEPVGGGDDGAEAMAEAKAMTDAMADELKARMAKIQALASSKGAPQEEVAKSVKSVGDEFKELNRLQTRKVAPLAVRMDKPQFEEFQEYTRTLLTPLSHQMLQMMFQAGGFEVMPNNSGVRAPQGYDEAVKRVPIPPGKEKRVPEAPPSGGSE